MQKYTWKMASNSLKNPGKILEFCGCGKVGTLNIVKLNNSIRVIFLVFQAMSFIHRTVTQQGFDGCIKDVQLGSALRDINDNTYALGVLPGCPEVSMPQLH